jgi:hypothetical protein
LKGAEVITEMVSLSGGEITVHNTGLTTNEIIADPIAVEKLSQEGWHDVTHRVSLATELVKTNSEALNLVVVRDEFDADTFDENVETEQHVEENDETTISVSVEENMEPSVDTTPDAPVGTGGEDNETNVPPSSVTLCDILISSRIDWGAYYTDKELRVLKLKYINLQDYLNHKDISHIGSTICDSAVVDDEGNPRV